MSGTKLLLSFSTAAVASVMCVMAFAASAFAQTAQANQFSDNVPWLSPGSTYVYMAGAASPLLISGNAELVFYNDGISTKPWNWPAHYRLSQLRDTVTLETIMHGLRVVATLAGNDGGSNQTHGQTISLAVYLEFAPFTRYSWTMPVEEYAKIYGHLKINADGTANFILPDMRGVQMRVEKGNIGVNFPEGPLRYVKRTDISGGSFFQANPPFSGSLPPLLEK